MGIGRRAPVGPQRNILGVQNQKATYIALSVRDMSGNNLFFRMKRSTQLRSLLIAYCDEKSAEFYRTRFLYEGVPLIPSRTPDEYGFESGDVIDAFPELRGGGAP